MRFDHAFSFGAVHQWSGPIEEAPDGALHPTAWRAPLFPWLIAAIWWNNPDVPPTPAVRVINALLGAGTAAGTFLLAAELTPHAAFAAGLIAAVWPIGVLTDATPLSEALFTFLTIAGVLLWQRRSYKLAGISFGLGGLARLTLLPLLILMPALALIPRFRNKGLVTISVCSLLTIAPWTIRNAIVLHRVIPVATAGSGANLLLGTVKIPPFSGTNLWSEYSKDPDIRALLNQGMEDTDTEAAMRGLALSRIASHPVEWAINRIEQYPRFLLDVGEYWPRPRLAPTLPRLLSLGLSALLVVLACAGAFSIRRHWEAWLPLLTVTATLLCLHLPIHAERRHGAPLVPLFAVFATALWQRTTEPSLR